MKHYVIIMIVFFLSALLLQSCKEESAQAVNPDLFLTNGTNYTIATVDCTLSDGTKASCYKITTVGLTPSDHEVGPWCPDHTDDNADKGGIWFKDGDIYDVTGKFITELPALYHDDFWKLHDDEGNVNKTTSKEDCLELANAQLVEKFKNYCIECLPEYVASLKKTYLIPISPVKLDEPISLSGKPKGKEGKDAPPRERPKGPPQGKAGGGGKQQPVVRGLAFNGIPFDAPAPTHIILEGYTIPPLDNAGGHINLDVGYHYHAATGQSHKHEYKTNHAAMIGYAMDGYGMYEQLNSDGKEPEDLDNCRGHYDETRGYHYHVDAAGNNNFINCFSGATASE